MKRKLPKLPEIQPSVHPDPELTPGIGMCLFVLCFILAVCLLLCAGCSTVEGIGKDLQNGSEIGKEYMAKPSYPQR